MGRLQTVPITRDAFLDELIRLQLRALEYGIEPLWVIRRYSMAIDSLIQFMEDEGYDASDIARAREYAGIPTAD